jgi:hypothetical protein
MTDIMNSGNEIRICLNRNSNFKDEKGDEKIEKTKKTLQETESVWNVYDKNIMEINNEKLNLSVIVQKRKNVPKSTWKTTQ